MHTTIPENIDAGQAVVNEILTDQEAYVGREIRGDRTKNLLLRIQTRACSYVIEFTLAGQPVSRVIGSAKKIPLEYARFAADAVQDKLIQSAADWRHVVGKALRAIGSDTLTVREAAEIAWNSRVESGVVAKSSARDYLSALDNCGATVNRKNECGENVKIKLSDAFLKTVTRNELVNIGEAVYNQRGADYFRKVRGAVKWAYEYAIDENAPDITVNHANAMKIRCIEEPDSAKRSATWDEIVAFWSWLSDPRCPLDDVEIRLHKAVLFLGERIGALLRLRWTDIAGDWLIIMPEDRKSQRRHIKQKRLDPLYIRMNSFLRDIFGAQVGTSPWIYPSKTDPSKPYPIGSLPLWALYRARNATCISQGINVLDLEREACWDDELNQPKNVLAKHMGFLLPDVIRDLSYHEFGRHTVSTLSQEIGIPTFYVSMMLGHTNDKKLPGRPKFTNGAFSKLGDIPRMPRALLRAAEAMKTAAPTTGDYYTHVATIALEGVEVAWFIWADVFSRMVTGSVSQEITDKIQEFRGPDDVALDLLIELFGSYEAAEAALFK